MNSHALNRISTAKAGIYDIMPPMFQNYQALGADSNGILTNYKYGVSKDNQGGQQQAPNPWINIKGYVTCAFILTIKGLKFNI